MLYYLDDMSKVNGEVFFYYKIFFLWKSWIWLRNFVMWIILVRNLVDFFVLVFIVINVDVYLWW